MSYQPPTDQLIVDQFFQLDCQRSHKSVAWLFAMIATYGITPEQLHKNQFDWQGNSLVLQNKKRPINPLHPQWVLLFQLKKKQPRNWQDCWPSVTSKMYFEMSHQKIILNVNDLINAYRIRKNDYKNIKRSQAHYSSFAGVS